MKSSEIKAFSALNNDIARIIFLLISHAIYMGSFSTPSESEITEELWTSWWDLIDSLGPE
jgi:hypothetical protein